LADYIAQLNGCRLRDEFGAAGVVATISSQIYGHVQVLTKVGRHASA
jgi:hypothetical protein